LLQKDIAFFCRIDNKIRFYNSVFLAMCVLIITRSSLYYFASGKIL